MLLLQAIFEPDQEVSQELVTLLPTVHDLIRGGVSQDVLKSRIVWYDLWSLLKLIGIKTSNVFASFIVYLCLIFIAGGIYHT